MLYEQPSRSKRLEGVEVGVSGARRVRNEDALLAVVGSGVVGIAELDAEDSSTDEAAKYHVSVGETGENGTRGALVPSGKGEFRQRCSRDAFESDSLDRLDRERRVLEAGKTGRVNEASERVSELRMRESEPERKRRGRRRTKSAP